VWGSGRHPARGVLVSAAKVRLIRVVSELTNLFPPRARTLHHLPDCTPIKSALNEYHANGGALPPIAPSPPKARSLASYPL
jgi:hypothetical protein